MKRITSLAASFVLISLLLACAPQPSQPINASSSDIGKITTEKAQRALNQWVTSAGSGQVSIVGGVRELPTENAANADLKLTELTYVSSQTKQTRHYSGAGTATFMHYTDCRWVLSKVTVGDVWANTSWTPNIDIR